MIRILRSDEVGDLLVRRGAKLEEAEAAVRPILEDVERRGDAALHEYARRFDGFQGKRFCVDPTEAERAAERLTPEFRSAMEQAARNVRTFAELQMPQEHLTEIAPGIMAGQIVRPIQNVAAYVPSGRYPLASTVMMTVIPAKVAGVRQVCVASARAVDEIDGTAHLLGADRIFRLGGAHAIAAFAFGTATVPQVDRIVGPGNVYVAAAKKLLAGVVGIDFVAGPTEILIIADDADARWLAADMLAQAEHDAEASAVLLTTSKKLAEEVAVEIERQLDSLPTAAVAREAITQNSAVVVVRSTEEAVTLANMFAPEHLSVYDESLLPGIENAGSVFVGPWSPEAAGDYAAGPNHVLPTNGHAILRGGLSAADFVKVISVQRLSAEGLRSIAGTVGTLARCEGLEAHARSVEARFAKANSGGSGA